MAVVLGLSAVAGWATRDFFRFINHPLPSPMVVEIGKGWSVSQIAQNLEEQGAIPSALWFILLVRWENFKNNKSIKAGEYNFHIGETPRPILNRLIIGDVVIHRLIIPEGLTVTEIALRMKRQGWETAESILADPAVTQKLGLHVPVLEGWLFPSTYYYRRGNSALEILRRMVHNAQKVFDQQWKIFQGLGRSNHSVPLSQYEALILASIIEKETGKEEERGRISAVFHNRLRKNMRLQTDPTVIYGLLQGPEAAIYKGNLTRKHLRTPTPYNTYTHFGLPPTPICNPGLAAIRAALYPDNAPDLYFVARGEGFHAFSKTLKQHEANVDRYQRKKP